MNLKQSSQLNAYIIKTNETIAFSTCSNFNDSFSSVNIYSAANLTKEDRETVELSLLNKAKKEVSLYLQNKHYIPRLILSALCFIIVYFFCSFVIRDPLPLIDEIIIALILSAIMWTYFLKRDAKIALKSKILLNVSKKIYTAEEQVLSQINDLEAFVYETRAKYDNLLLADMIANNKIENLSFSLDNEFKDALYYYLKHSKLYYYFKKIGKDKNIAAMLINASLLKKIDLAFLYFLSCAFKQN